MKIWKAAVGVGTAGIGAAAGLADYAIAEYFFRRTMLRRKASTERTIKMAGTSWERYLPEIERRREKMMKYPHRDVYLYSADGLKLHAVFFPAGQGRPCPVKKPEVMVHRETMERHIKMDNPESAEEMETPGRDNRLVICFHGYTGKGMSDFVGLSDYYLPRGYAMLLVDERAHGDSEGQYVGFGCLDREDALRWARYGEKLMGPGCRIWMHGISMGGAAVLMAGGLELPSSVKGIIADCAFTSAWDVFSHVLKNQYHLWPEPILWAADRMARKRAGYSLAQCNAAEEARRFRVPVLLIHGGEDSFVPCSMCREIYNNCPPGKRDILIVPGAGHAEAYYKAGDIYEEKLTQFLEA